MSSDERVQGRPFLIGLAAIVALAVGLRLAVVEQYEARHPMAAIPVIDEQSYDEWAQRIAAGEWLGDEVFFQEPGYAYGLALVYASGPNDTRLIRARRVQALVGGLCVLLTGLLASRLFGRTCGWIAAAALAVYRPALLASCLLLKVNVAMPVLLGIALVLERGRRRGWPVGTALGLGALAGLGALLRGNVLVLIPALVLWPLVRRAPLRRRLVSAACVAAGALAALSPVLVRNYVVGGRPVVTNGAGTNFYGGNNAANPDGVATEFDWVRGIPEYELGDWHREAERRLKRELEPREVSSYWLSAALQSMRSDPWLHARIFWNKTRLLLSAFEVPDNHSIEWDARHVPLLRWPWGGFGLFGLVGLAGVLVFLGRRRPLAAWDTLVFLVLYAGTIVLTVMSMRARLAIVPLLLPFAGWLVIDLVRAWRARERGRLGLQAAALLVAGLAVHVPYFSAEEVRQELDERDYNLATNLLAATQERLEGGALDAADVGADPTLVEVQRLADELTRRYPEDPRLIVLQARLELLRGQASWARAAATAEERAEGERLLRSALARLERVDREAASARQRFWADFVSGWILQALGRFDAAAAAYRSARRFDDDDRDVRRRLALCVANVAVASAEPERSAGLREALGLYDGLIAERSEPELERLRAQVAAALEAGSDR